MAEDPNLKNLQATNDQLASINNAFTSIAEAIKEAIDEANDDIKNAGNLVDKLNARIKKTSFKDAVKSITDLNKGVLS